MVITLMYGRQKFPQVFSMDKIISVMAVRKFRPVILAFILALFSPPTMAVDPLYQPEMQKLLGAIGSLYFLQPLCGNNEIDWRQHASELIALDQPDEDRRQRLNGSFNQGYYAYARLYQTCTEAAQLATGQILLEAKQLTRDIHSRYGEQN